MQQVIYRIIKDKMLRIAGQYGTVPQYLPFDNKLIILSTTNEVSIAPSPTGNITDARFTLEKGERIPNLSYQ